MDEDEEGGGDEVGDGKGQRWYWQAHMENSVSCMKINPTDHASVCYDFDDPLRTSFESAADSIRFPIADLLGSL